MRSFDRHLSALLTSMLLCLGTWVMSPSQLLASERTLIQTGETIDGLAALPLGPRCLVIENGRIAAIEKARCRPDETDTFIDLGDQTVLPGFMDMHVHLLGESSPSSYLRRYQDDPADAVLDGVVYARRTLEAGFTTVRDLGGETSAITALRDAINRGKVIGPTIYAATASLASTGGHGDPSNGLNRALSWHPTPADGVVNSTADARQAVRQRYKEGADLIKITATGGVLSLAKSGQNPQFTEDEVRAIVEAAQDYGFHVAAHAHGTEGIKRAVRAGVRSIEHGTYLDQEAMELMKERGTFYVPTISAGRFVAEKAKIDGYYPEIIRPKAAQIGPVIQETFSAAWDAGVRIAFGTDCGVCVHGDNAHEFVYMVEAGMPPMKAILSATSETAELLEIADDVGTLSVGKRADIVAVEDDPLTDIKALLEVGFVMKGGVVYKNTFG